MATVQQTIRYIEAHGHFAAETAEGVLASTLCVWTLEGAAANGIPADDRSFDDVSVFPVTDGEVSARDVRAWLGY